MAGVESWKKRIIEKFIERSHPEPYYITDKKELLDSFGNIEYPGNTAWDELWKDEILVSSIIEGRQRIYLNPNKRFEILQYYSKQPVEEVMAVLEPPPSAFDGLERRFEIVTNNAWPRQGTYYLCTLIADPASWVALYRSKPGQRITRMNLGSLLDKNSKIVSMWTTIYVLGKREPTFYKKQAEDDNQQAFSNNRQPGTAAFKIFCHLGLIREVDHTGRSVLYSLNDTELYDRLVNGNAYVCRGCSRIYRERYCAKCASHI